MDVASATVRGAGRRWGVVSGMNRDLVPIEYLVERWADMILYKRDP